MRPEDGSSKGGGIEITVERRGVAAPIGQRSWLGWRASSKQHNPRR
jgi:hypothetical protein